jgi:mono/diheme cytochrome c family protein
MAQAQEEGEGKRLFGEFCTACHGVSAAGGGEIADLLSVPVPDLTKLSANNDGEFPMLRVIHVIDGRTGMRAHGGPMPLFGAMFSSSAAADGKGYGSVTETRGRILSIALYLESIQG